MKGKYEAPSWLIELPLFHPLNLNEERISNMIRKNIEKQDEKILGTGGAEESIAGSILEDKKEEEEEKDSESVPFEISKPSEHLADSEEEAQVVDPKIFQHGLDFDQPKLTVISTSDVSTPDEESLDTQDDTFDIVKEFATNLKESPGFRWHIRLGHTSLHYLLELQKCDPTLSKVVFDESINHCDICTIIKMTKLLCRETKPRATKPF